MVGESGESTEENVVGAGKGESEIERLHGMRLTERSMELIYVYVSNVTNIRRPTLSTDTQHVGL